MSELSDAENLLEVLVLSDDEVSVVDLTELVEHAVPIGPDGVPLGLELDLMKPPFAERIPGFLLDEDFGRSFHSTPLRNVLPLWHPRISVNGDIPLSFSEYQFFVMGPVAGLDLDGIAEYHLQSLALVIHFLQGIFTGDKSDRARIKESVPRCRHLMVTSASGIVGVISFIVCGDGDVIVTEFAVASRTRRNGIGTFLVVALFKSLLAHRFSRAPCLYLQCLPEKHIDSPMGFYKLLGFTEVFEGWYPESDPYGIQFLPKEVQDAGQGNGVIVPVEDDAIALRWLTLSHAQLAIPEPMRKLLVPPAVAPHLQPWPVIPKQYASDMYAEFPCSGMSWFASMHCLKGLHLLVSPNDCKDGRTNALLANDKQVHRRFMHPQGFLTFQDRAGLTATSWMTSNILDFVLSLIQADGYYKHDCHVIPPLYWNNSYSNHGSLPDVQERRRLFPAWQPYGWFPP
jgi:hypothetical protein